VIRYFFCVGLVVNLIMDLNGECKGGDGFIDRSRVRILLCDNDSTSLGEVFTLLSECSYQGMIYRFVLVLFPKFLFLLCYLLLSWDYYFRLQISYRFLSSGFLSQYGQM